MKPSLSLILVIAKNTYRELIRERLLYGVFLIAALVTALSFFLSTVSLGQNARIMQNIGLATIHLFSLFILVFVTTNSVAKDLDRRTVYFLFPKPISRGQYVVGKYVGLLFLLLTTLVILGAIFLIGVFFTDKTLVDSGLISLLFSFIELSLLIALAQLFASFTAPLNASLYTIALYIIGHSYTFVREFLAVQGSTFSQRLLDVCYYILPNLEKFDVRAATLYNISLGFSQVFWTVFYWLIYTGFILFITTQVVRKREF